MATRQMKLLADDKVMAFDNAPHTRASKSMEYIVRFIRINLIDYGKYFGSRIFHFYSNLISRSIAVHHTSHITQQPLPTIFFVPRRKATLTIKYSNEISLQTVHEIAIKYMSKKHSKAHSHAI